MLSKQPERLDISVLRGQLDQQAGRVRLSLFREDQEGSLVTALASELDELIDCVPAPARRKARQRRVVTPLSSKLDCLVPSVGVAGLSSR